MADAGNCVCVCVVAGKQGKRWPRWKWVCVCECKWAAGRNVDIRSIITLPPFPPCGCKVALVASSFVSLSSRPRPDQFLPARGSVCTRDQHLASPGDTHWQHFGQVEKRCLLSISTWVRIERRKICVHLYSAVFVPVSSPGTPPPGTCGEAGKAGCTVRKGSIIDQRLAAHGSAEASGSDRADPNSARINYSAGFNCADPNRAFFCPSFALSLLCRECLCVCVFVDWCAGEKWFK